MYSPQDPPRIGFADEGHVGEREPVDTYVSRPPSRLGASGA